MTCSQWQSGCRNTFLDVLRDGEEMEASSSRRVLPHSISSGAAELMSWWLWTVGRCRLFSLQTPAKTEASESDFFSFFPSAHDVKLFWWKQWKRVLEKRWCQVFSFNRCSWCLSSSSSLAGLWAPLGVAALGIIALNTGSTERGYKAPLCCLHVWVYVCCSCLDSLTLVFFFFFLPDFSWSSLTLLP